MVRFSVIIPVYNVAPYLRECLDSVLVAAEKMNGSVEIICVDDGSTDGSSAILDEYASRQSNNQTIPNRTVLRVLHQPNRGVSAARNAALDVATGDWILFVDGDDLVSALTLKICRYVIERTPDIDMVRFRYTNFLEAERPTGLATELPSQEKIVDITTDLAAEIAASAFFTVAYRRGLIAATHFEVGRRLGEDVLFFSDVLQRCRKVSVIESVGYAYRQRHDSATHLRKSGATLREELSCWTTICGRLLKRQGSVDAKCIRERALGLTETFARNYYHLPYAERRGLLPFWRQEMKRLGKGVSAFPRWQRTVIWLLCRVPFSPLMWSLCFLPDFLKRKGLHR